MDGIVNVTVRSDIAPVMLLILCAGIVVRKWAAWVALRRAKRVVKTRRRVQKVIQIIVKAIWIVA